MARCEDYPCCGHTDGLPCDWSPPDYSDPAVAAASHIGCDHEAGYCDYDDYDEDDEGDGDGTWDLDDYDEDEELEIIDE